MPAPTKTDSTPRPNGMTDEQVRYALAALGRRKNDPEYLRRLEEGVAEYRRTIQDELERELADEGKKFHAKAYLVRRPMFLSELGVLGRGNFTRAGLTQNIESSFTF